MLEAVPQCRPGGAGQKARAVGRGDFPRASLLQGGSLWQAMSSEDPRSRGIGSVRHLPSKVTSQVSGEAGAVTDVSGMRPQRPAGARGHNVICKGKTQGLAEGQAETRSRDRAPAWSLPTPGAMSSELVESTAPNCPHEHRAWWSCRDKTNPQALKPGLWPAESRGGQGQPPPWAGVLTVGAFGHGICAAGSHSALAWFLLSFAPSAPFGMAVYTSCLSHHGALGF